MSFHPITVNSKTFNQAGDGKYMLSTVSFGQPLNYFKISGGSRNSKSGVTSAAISRVLEKDVVVDGRTIRRNMTVQVIVQLSDGFTSAEADTVLGDIDGFIAIGVLDRILNGET